MDNLGKISQTVEGRCQKEGAMHIKLHLGHCCYRPSNDILELAEEHGRSVEDVDSSTDGRH